jgi:hypothetical protein
MFQKTDLQPSCEAQRSAKATRYVTTVILAAHRGTKTDNKVNQQQNNRGIRVGETRKLDLLAAVPVKTKRSKRKEKKTE